ncbi:hypothetical protein MA16_Dca002834 [Dendrobium catenatum]|uniref:Uncharacterized protein n=1 Tax=Dendrobium catenatum TaxID=906689 RepID=A0A2I0X8V3_9ASPA|nr:hypothetical protein MA16_Dca002834 [Dendrobium catenatum]
MIDLISSLQKVKDFRRSPTYLYSQVLLLIPRSDPLASFSWKKSQSLIQKVELQIDFLISNPFFSQSFSCFYSR